MNVKHLVAALLSTSILVACTAAPPLEPTGPATFSVDAEPPVKPLPPIEAEPPAKPLPPVDDNRPSDR
jgi:hypothetical protein